VKFPPSFLSSAAASAPEPLATVACPACLSAVVVSADLFGRAAECPVCGSGFRVPLPGVFEASQEQTQRPVLEPEQEPEPEPELSSNSELKVPIELRLNEQVRTVGSGDNVIELRRLTPEEKAARRTRRSVIMMCAGVSLLMAIVLLLGTKPSKRRS